MTKIELNQMVSIQGGELSEFCKGFGIVAISYQAGVWANLWNPVGQITAGVGILIGAGCAIDALT